MSIIRKYLFLVTILCFSCVLGQIPRVPISPCPDIFLYKFENGEWCGDITVHATINQGKIELATYFVIGEKVDKESYAGDLRLEDENQAIKRMEKGLPLHFKVTFPPNYKLPHLTNITMNGHSICYRPDDFMKPKSNIFLQVNVRWAPEQSTNDVSKISDTFQSTVPRPTPIIQRPTPIIQRPTPAPNPLIIPQTPEPSYPEQQENLSECGVADSQYPNPWLVGLLKFEGKEELYCTGILISNKHVIAAAHCTDIDSRSRILLNFGTNNLSIMNVARLSLKIFPHVDFDRDTHTADLSIILLNEEITFSSNIKPICLWQKEFNQISLNGQLLRLVGWQANENKLIEKNVIMKPLNECNKLDSNIVLENMICTLDQPQIFTRCAKLIGGFLIVSLNKKLTLRSILTAPNVDLKSSNCIADSHTLFTDIAKFLDWIKLYINR